MPIPPQKLREVVFQLLYSHDHGQTSLTATAQLLAKELKLSKKSLEQALLRVKNVIEHIEQLDRRVAKASDSYDWHRIPRVERNVLRLGLYELLWDKSIPPKVAMSEALRITRKFSTAEAVHFVNAVLDHIYKEEQGNPVSDEAVSNCFQEFAASQEIARKAGEEKASESSEE